MGARFVYLITSVVFPLNDTIKYTNRHDIGTRYQLSVSESIYAPNDGYLSVENGDGVIVCRVGATTKMPFVVRTQDESIQLFVRKGTYFTYETNTGSRGSVGFFPIIE